MSGSVFTHAHRVTYAECTLGNHIYYSRYLDLLEAARGEFFRSLNMTFRELHENDTLFPVIDVHLRYKAAARYDDVIQIEVTVAELERVRLTFSYRILRGEELLLQATTTHACASASDKLKRLPPEVLEKLSPYRAAGS